MIVWRITNAANAARALSGEGAFRYPGRWNMFGTPMIYTAGTSALAVLEYVAHVPRSVPRPAQIVLLKIELPDASVEELTEAKIPADWDAIPAPMSTQTLGTEWAQSLRSVALVVPTVLLPRGGDANVLINPLHEGMARVRVTDDVAFDLDSRVLGDAS